MPTDTSTTFLAELTEDQLYDLLSTKLAAAAEASIMAELISCELTRRRVK